MTRTAPELAPPFQTSAPHQREDYVWFNVQQAQYMTLLQWNRVSNLEPTGPKSDTLPLGNRGLPPRWRSFHENTLNLGELGVEVEVLPSVGCRSRWNFWCCHPEVELKVGVACSSGSPLWQYEDRNGDISVPSRTS
ncbi:hypothetical protein AVEN_211791-1 [Araneus ventricosus]|uniref:Uncharacterized protein n=1 Tax=Araneus ventricosus TaxID=182803 RepID=A0A4Y2X0M5_ARAVE|nr:hypothetical protein AVEN_211791-1 [Araneus ventricosus]